MLKGKTVLLGITGGIAAYKAAYLTSALVKLHASVEVVMTRNATEFIAPLTFEQLTGNKVMVDTFDRNFVHQVEHIALADRTDLVMIAPATANVCAKLAHGLADDMLTTTVLACTCPKLIAPAMNTHMYENPVTQDNLDMLRRYGWEVIAPASGRLACGAVGAGKLPEPQDLLQYILREIAFPHDLKGKRVLVTAGPTQESLAPVRYLTNHSTGKMGYAIAGRAAMRGAEVTAVTGSSVSRDLLPKGIPNLSRVDCGTAAEMYDAAAAAWPDCSMGFFSAAVADFSPVPYGSHKFKKADAQNGFSVEFAPNRDILATLAAARRPGQKMLGFAAETASSMEELLGLARKKRQRKGCDVIAANIVGRKGSGFASETNSMAVAGPGEAGEIWETRSKADVAWDLCSCLLNA